MSKTELTNIPIRENEDEPLSLGRLAYLLNPYQSLNLYGGTSFLFLHLTNECDYRCSCCYTDSQPGLKNTRLPFSLTQEFIKESFGIDEIVLSGGEISFLPGIEQLINQAAEAAKLVTVYTNGSGFLNRRLIREAEENPKLVQRAVLISLENKLQLFPPNVEFAFPVTNYHLNNPHRQHRYHRGIITTASELARKWQEEPNRSAIRFIVKNTPGQPGSGEKLIEEFNLAGLGATGAVFPGSISAEGRGAEISEAKEVDFIKFEGGLYINYNGVYVNPDRLVFDLHHRIKGHVPQEEGKIFSFPENAILNGNNLNCGDIVNTALQETETYLKRLTNN